MTIPENNPVIHDFVLRPLTDERTATVKKGDTVFCLHPYGHNFVKMKLKGIEWFPCTEVQSTWRKKEKHVEKFRKYMPDNSNFAKNLQELEDLRGAYENVDYPLVSKEEYSWGGAGIKKFQNFDELSLHFKKNQHEIKDGIAIQKYVPNGRDYKILIMGDYNYVFQRFNDDDFRKNVDNGGYWEDLTLEDLPWDTQVFCRRIYEESEFPFIFIDILDTNARTYLMEVGLTAEHWSPRTPTTKNSISREDWGRMQFQHLKDFYLPGTELPVHENVPWSGDEYDDSYITVEVPKKKKVKPSLPEKWIEIVTNTDCNWSCEYCSFDRVPKKQMTMETLKKHAYIFETLDKLREKFNLKVVLEGGEIGLMEDNALLRTLMWYIDQKVIINTNGEFFKTDRSDLFGKIETVFYHVAPDAKTLFRVPELDLPLPVVNGLVDDSPEDIRKFVEFNDHLEIDYQEYEFINKNPDKLDTDIEAVRKRCYTLNPFVSINLATETLHPCTARGAHVQIPLTEENLHKVLSGYSNFKEQNDMCSTCHRLCKSVDPVQTLKDKKTCGNLIKK